MFQPEAKCEFVRRYCPPAKGWVVFVDIDASEEGRTGGERKSPKAKERQKQMRRDAAAVRMKLDELEVTVGRKRAAWFAAHGLPPIPGDRDIVAFHRKDNVCVVAEVEAISSGQAEQKVYKAVGQIVSAASAAEPDGWTIQFVVAVHGDKMATHLRRMKALETLGISGLSLSVNEKDDVRLFGPRLRAADTMDEVVRMDARSTK